jgi:hypothetical protein
VQIGTFIWLKLRDGDQIIEPDTVENILFNRTIKQYVNWISVREAVRHNLAAVNGTAAFNINLAMVFEEFYVASISI